MQFSPKNVKEKNSRYTSVTNSKFLTQDFFLTSINLASDSKLLYFETAKDPVSVKCPVAGKFNFTQKGEKDLLLQTRILGGVTRAPWDGIYCRENISDFSVCDKDQKEIWIDVNYCITVDAYGRMVDIYSKSYYQ